MPRAPPSYADHDLGLMRRVDDAAREQRDTEEQYQRMRARLALVESEEAKTRMRLQRALVAARAQEDRKKVQTLREQDSRRRQEIDSHLRRAKEMVCSMERQRKEQARAKLEGLFNTKRQQVEKVKLGWERQKQQRDQEASGDLAELRSLAKESRDTQTQRRQARKDTEEVKAQRIGEQRVRERHHTEQMLKERHRMIEEERLAYAREQRERARDGSSRRFDDLVRDRKRHVAADVQQRVAARKDHAADMKGEMASLERREAAVRRRLESAKAQLAEADYGGLGSEAVATPRMQRSR
eukprot:TRINITY_DN46847_c0_g1_i1.p2 TRINITY_DN46847_c0_g1~~TRINITY_DN46847_c0_g1_i1.p2  ORF type:complete len:326 (+),score=143.49 TRINITY_DN46847_c0_g1_i1:88-978(+)